MSSNYEEIRLENIKEYGEGNRHLAHFATMYSERTHFIFELLQNAEDALKGRPPNSPDGYVQFRLFLDRLEIRHNGQSFSAKDVTGVCGIGEGTKAGDCTQIGKFGIGFKSVYAYTFSPKIYSGDENFKISRFVEPHAIEPQSEGDTLIVLPFDESTSRPDWALRDNIDAADAVQEIGEALRNLDIRTLLFLNHIKEIQWELPDGSSGHFIRKSSGSVTSRDGRTVTICDQSDEIEEWRIFHKDVEIQDADKKHLVRVEVAFLIRDKILVRALNTELVVFFPTNIKTELGFLIHAPFKTTPARDNIKADDTANRQMIDAAASLASDALESLRDQGLLKVSSYAALPLQRQDFPDASLFKPVFDKIREALKTRQLLPLHNGAYARADEVKLARSKRLVELFSAEQLSSLFGDKKFEWLDSSITENGDFYLYLVGSSNDTPPLTAGIQVDADNLAPKLTEDFLSKQLIDWLIKFVRYVIFGPKVFKSVPFVRITSGRQTGLPANTFAVPSAWFAPAKEFGLVLTSFDLVASELTADSEIKTFLEKEGIREIDDGAIVGTFLSDYKSDTLSWDLDKYNNHLKCISRAYQGTDAAKKELLASLSNTPWIACVHSSGSNDDEIVWRKPGAKDLFVRDAESETWFRGLTEVKAYFPHKAVSDGLEGATQELTKLSKITQNLPLDETKFSLEGNRYTPYRQCFDGFNPNAKLAGLKDALENWNLERFEILWCIMLAAPRIISGETQSSMRKGQLNTAEKKIEKTEVFLLLTENLCIPDQSGDWHKPAEFSLSDLPDEFEKSSNRAENVARRLRMKLPVDSQIIAKSLGISPENFEFAMTLTTEERESIKSDRERKRNIQNFPNKVFTSLERRAEKIRDEVKNTPPKKTEIRERTVDLDYSPAQGEARTYLKDQYTEDDVMFCQLCRAPQPVLINGEAHFEAVGCIGDVNIYCEGNNLALCPNHAAMYKRSGIQPAVIQEKVLTCEGLVIALNLAGNPCELQFTEQHLADLRTVINALSQRTDEGCIERGDN